MTCRRSCDRSALPASFTFRSSCWRDRFGIATSRRRREYEARLACGRAFWNVLPVVEETTTHYASIRRQLKEAGASLPANDVWIAALARQHELPVVSRYAHFYSVSCLTLLSWLS